MIDVPPKPPVHYERIVKQLVDCGLDAQSFTVQYEDYLQSVEIVIRKSASVAKSQFPCISKVAGYEIVTFEEEALQSAYSAFTTELFRPRMIAETAADMKRLGLLDGFPKRASFTSLREYARALERHSGIGPGTVLKVSADSIVFDPPRETDPQRFSQKYGKILAAVMYASAIGDTKFGFIGNEASSETSAISE